jgi:squalene cyclase
MTVWALSEAKARGYEVSDTLAETTKWTKERLATIDKPRDARPGWNMVNTPAVYLALMAEALPAQDALTPADLKGIAGHLVRHQESDGSWAWSLAPAANRPPPVFESDEVVTLMAETILGSRARSEPDGTSPTCEAISRATAWHKTNSKPGPSTQATAVRLFRDVRASAPPEEHCRGVERLLSLQNEDGGWGQLDDLPSDAYATGQALYFLSLGGVEPDRAEIRKGVAFLVATQKPDGSWPMTSRAQPGAKPFRSPVPITYFGSAWATLGLLRSTTK